MFVWSSGPPELDAEDVYCKAIKRKVAFVPGKFFYTDNPAISPMRLNFSTVDPDTIRKGIEILAEAIKEMFNLR